jgi:hypothetical protein
LTPRQIDWDRASFIFPLAPSSETPGGDRKRKFSTETDMEPTAKYSSSSLLLAAPKKVRKSESLKRKADHCSVECSSSHLQKKDDHSGYWNFSDTRDECDGVIVLNHHRCSSTLSELMLSNPSLRDTLSPEPHTLEVSDAEGSAPSGRESPEKEGMNTAHASNPAFWLTHESNAGTNIEDTGHTTPSSPPVVKTESYDDHQEKDSGFPTLDSPHPLHKDSGFPMLDSPHPLHKDSGFPTLDSSRPLHKDSGFPTLDSSRPLHKDPAPEGEFSDKPEGNLAQESMNNKYHLTEEDSGFPVEDSSSPLIPGKNTHSRVAETITAHQDSHVMA